jgi:hypothetical protein
LCFFARACDGIDIDRAAIEVRRGDAAGLGRDLLRGVGDIDLEGVGEASTKTGLQPRATIMLTVAM